MGVITLLEEQLYTALHQKIRVFAILHLIEAADVLKESLGGPLDTLFVNSQVDTLKSRRSKEFLYRFLYHFHLVIRKLIASVRPP